jgi:hypothetical protein
MEVLCEAAITLPAVALTEFTIGTSNAQFHTVSRLSCSDTSASLLLRLSRSAWRRNGASRLRVREARASAAQRVQHSEQLAWCAFHDSSRNTSRRPVRTSWHGRRSSACTNVANSIPSNFRFAARCFSRHWPGAYGRLSANPPATTEGLHYSCEKHLVARSPGRATTHRRPCQNAGCHHERFLARDLLDQVADLS